MASLSGPSDLILFEAESSRLLVCRGAEVDFYDNGHSGEKDVTDSIQVNPFIQHCSCAPVIEVKQNLELEHSRIILAIGTGSKQKKKTRKCIPIEHSGYSPYI